MNNCNLFDLPGIEKIQNAITKGVTGNVASGVITTISKHRQP